MIGLVLIASQNNIVGNNTKLPCEPSDHIINFIRSATKDKVVVQGSTAFIYNGPITNNGCISVVVSSMKDKLPDGYDYVTEGSAEEILKDLNNKYPDKDIMILGGMSMYELFIDFMQDFYIARIESDIQGNLMLNSNLMHYIEKTSCKKSEVPIPEIPTFPKTKLIHYRRSSH